MEHIGKPHSPTEWWVGDPQSLPLATELEKGRVVVPQVLLRPGFLHPDSCAALTKAFKRNQHRAPPAAPYWSGRFIWASSLDPVAELSTLRILQTVRDAALTAIALHFDVRRHLYSDTTQLVHWPPGVALTPHADNTEPNGQPNSTPHRCFSSILYLNDNYTGGETYFPFLGFRIKPQTGSLLAFRSDASHAHGVTRIETGHRYTCANWFTFDQRHEDPHARIIY